ncbi:MAG: DUF998 domain-containing protein [Nitrososphaerota archaeon]|nr:DUF998 domain-containing protein [Nitrososphaerota archaeon]
MTERAAPLSKARAEQNKRRRFETIAGASFLAGAAEFLLLTTIAESLYPAYNVRDQALSELGVGHVALLWNASLFLLGVAVIFGGYFAHRSMASRLSATLSFILGIGFVGAAIFPLNSPTGIHGFFGLLAFASGGLFALTSYRVVGSKGMKLFSILFGVYSFISLVLLGFDVNLGLGVGGMERMIDLPLVIWLSAFGGYLLHTRNE